MICAYCKKEKEAKEITHEHIIPKGIIDLFPECDYVFDRRLEGTKVYKGESKINDVCADCNNGQLSYLDNYGTQFIKKYFLKEYSKDEILSIEYDYNLLSRWLLKIIFNTERSIKSQTLRDTLWFDENIDYILGIKSNPQYYISIFSGIFVNTSPMPLFWANDRQLDIISNPVLLSQGLLMLTPGTDDLRPYAEINKNIKDMKMENLYLKYIIRFGTGMFLILMWNKEANKEQTESYEKIINTLFPYKLISGDNTIISIERCTHAFNITTPQIVDSYIGMNAADLTNCFMPSNVDPMETNKELSVNWNEYVKDTREESNNKKQKKNKRKNKKKRH